MAFIQGMDRTQTWLLPESLDQYVAEDHPVRAIDFFVSCLDLARLKFCKAVPAETGRPPYDPGVLLRLFLWGHQNRLRSSRKLEKETGRNLELLWLLCKLQPDHKTIAEFRRQNLAALKEVATQFVLICREAKLCGGGEVVAIDGTKLKASNHPASKTTPAALAVEKARLEAQIQQEVQSYLLEAEEVDLLEAVEEAAVAGVAKKLPKEPARLAALRRRCEQVARALESASESGAATLGRTDPEAQSMQKVGLGYNAQIAVDSRLHLIVAAEVVRAPTDHEQLPVMAEVVRQVLQDPAVPVTADRGFHHQQALAKAEAAGVQSYVPAPKMGHAASRGMFAKSDFVYEAHRDGYRCPAGELLTRKGQGFQQKGQRYFGYTNPVACQGCQLRAQCTKSRSRRIERWEEEAVLEAVAERVEAHPEITRRRKGLVEHPFGTIKFWWGHGAVLTRGRESVQAEWSLSTLAYNLQRVLTVLGLQGFRNMLARVQAKVRATRQSKVEAAKKAGVEAAQAGAAAKQAGTPTAGVLSAAKSAGTGSHLHSPLCCRSAENWRLHNYKNALARGSGVLTQSRNLAMPAGPVPLAMEGVSAGAEPHGQFRLP